MSRTLIAVTDSPFDLLDPAIAALAVPLELRIADIRPWTSRSLQWRVER